MGLMNAVAKRLFRPKALSLTDDKSWNASLWRLFGSISQSGESVDEYSALNYSAVWNATSLIAGTIGSLPLHLMKKDGDSKDKIQKHPLYKILYAKPNPYMTAMQLREALTGHILLWGNCYAEIERANGTGKVLNLWPITPNRVKIKWEDDQLVYEIEVGSEKVYLTRDKVLHVAGIGFDGFGGYSVIAHARKSIGLSMAMETFGSLFFGNGTHPSVVVKHPGKLSDQAHSNLKGSLTEKYASLGNSHRLMLLEEGMDIERMAINPEDSQFLQSRQFQIPEVARWFNLPPHKLKDLSRSSFNNIESEQISFVTDSIRPWVQRFEQAFNMQLLTEKEHFTDNLYFKHSLEGLLRGATKDRAEFYGKMFNIGAMSINEIRGKEDLNPDPDPLADEKFVPSNMMPLSKVGEKKDETQEPFQAESEGQIPDREQNRGRIHRLPLR